MDAESFIRECAAVGLATGVDSRGLVHVVDDGWRNCQETGDGHGLALSEPTADSRECMFCRELPGRERHALKVLT